MGGHRQRKKVTPADGNNGLHLCQSYYTRRIIPSPHWGDAYACAYALIRASQGKVENPARGGGEGERRSAERGSQCPLTFPP